MGVTANSHKVITSLIKEAVRIAREGGHAITAVHSPGADKSGELESTEYQLDRDYAHIRAGLASGEIQLLGGTSWLWSRDEFRDSVDVLVVDEAGQVSLANALAVSLAAKNLILFGDPAQLDQPQKGVHPEGADVSALEHLLGDALTLPDDRGVFLPETRRLPPAICEFTSRVFYEGRLAPMKGLETQRIDGPEPLKSCPLDSSSASEASSRARRDGAPDLGMRGSGLRFVPVAHRGNTNRSDEEVDVVERLIRALLASGARYVDRPLAAKDVLVVAPYNAQVAALRRRMPDGVAVGTVDKFQGQQAPIVFYSMTSSSADDAPRGMDFLYSMNRLNVATSRAQALVVLVASPELTRVRCRRPRQMRLANALCAYLEMAREIG